MSEDDTAATTGRPTGPERLRHPWWKTPDTPSRALGVGCLFAISAICSWILVADGASWRVFHLVLAIVFSVVSGRSLATWLTARGERG